MDSHSSIWQAVQPDQDEVANLHCTPNSIVYTASGRGPVCDQRHARSFVNADRFLCLRESTPFARTFWCWTWQDEEYSCQTASLTLRRDALPNISQQLKSSEFAAKYVLPKRLTIPQPVLVLRIDFLHSSAYECVD